MTSTTSNITRITYSNAVRLQDGDNLIVRKRNGERRILSSKWFINRHTPVGEDAELFERKAYGGRRLIFWDDLIAIERTQP